MSYENYILDAIERVLALDVPEEELGRVASSHAASMAKVGSDQGWASDAV